MPWRVLVEAPGNSKFVALSPDLPNLFIAARHFFHSLSQFRRLIVTLLPATPDFRDFPPPFKRIHGPDALV